MEGGGGGGRAAKDWARGVGGGGRGREGWRFWDVKRAFA